MPRPLGVCVEAVYNPVLLKKRTYKVLPRIHIFSLLMMEVVMSDVLGIDIAQKSFDATLRLQTGQIFHQNFENTPDGFSALGNWLDSHQVTQLHACMEATNIYWEGLANWLHFQNHIVSVVNPARIKGFAQATMQRNKTDKLDSAIIAAFCASHQPRAWQPRQAHYLKLRALTRHRDDLLQTRLQQQNRLRDTTDPVVRASLQALLVAIATQITAVEEAIKTHIAEHHDLHTLARLLTSIVGIGSVTAALLLAELASVENYETAKSMAADVGVTTSHFESGTSVRRRPHISKQGNANLRSALYLPAMTAMRCCKAIQVFAHRLEARGKAKKVVICAVIRKLIHIIFGVLKHQTPYDPAKVSQM